MIVRLSWTGSAANSRLYTGFDEATKRQFIVSPEVPCVGELMSVGSQSRCSSLYLILQYGVLLEMAGSLPMVVRQRSFFPSQSGWRQGMFAAASCRSTSGLDAVSPRCSF